MATETAQVQKADGALATTTEIPSSRASSSPSSEQASDLQQASQRNAQQPLWQRRRNILIAAAVLIVVLAIVIPVAVVFSNKSSSNDGEKPSAAASSNSAPKSNGNGGGSSSHAKSKSIDADVPKWAKGGYLDPSTWYTTKDFNTTFTNETIGGLYVMGLNSTWDDSTRANKNVPPLNEQWRYGTMPIQGVNIGGWFLLEPFLTPSLWDQYPLNLGIIDEWTLSAHLGDKAKSTIEEVYATFGNEEDFAQIQAAGFDHVRLPFGYWAVQVYDNDPYVPMVSFRYILRSIEWARKYGLRIFLDLHAVPGSQNGWTHSGHVGSIDWLKGPNGALNGQRTLEIHKQLATFFSQPRYKNIVTLYGLVNEPKMPSIGVSTVLDWYDKAIPDIRNSGYKNLIIMSEGFIPLGNWAGQMQQYPDLVLDIHQYLVYDDELLSMTHAEKVDFACTEWVNQTEVSSSTATGFGPTIMGEWSYADTECALYQNGVGVGSRWNGSFDGGAPECPSQDKSQCTCTPANAQASDFSDGYKLWMSTFLQAQISAWQGSWGWFHWTWKSAEDGVIAVPWTYKAGLDAGYLPKNIQQLDWNCANEQPSYAGLPETY